ncbi:MAG: hypothetical protein HQL92_03710, partial [Magnetococcales bacterium]|nr:hypothetical protein [Magnetococcales bacterium]
NGHKALVFSQFTGYLAIIALAHKILKIVFILLARKEAYRDSTVDYEAFAVKRNAPRWIAKLRQFGLLPAAA